MVEQDSARVAPEELHATCVTILAKAGLSLDGAALVADCLVEADLRGVDTHGVIHLPIYVQRIALGLINPQPQLAVLQETSATALLDGDRGLGQVVAAGAMDRAIGLAGQSGVGLVGVRNSTHFGMAACFSMRALTHGMIGIAISSARATMPPWGGAEARVGNNPLSVAIPAGREQPIVLDMALSAVARGKIKRAKQLGETIPSYWATDRQGGFTVDPAEALAGLLRPIGGPKGYGLALVHGLLASVLMGGGFDWETGSLYDDLDRAQSLGHLLVAIAVESFMPVVAFRQRVDKLVQAVRSSPRAPNVERVYLPGEIEFECRERRSREGIPLSSQLWQRLRKMAQESDG